MKISDNDLLKKTKIVAREEQVKTVYLLEFLLEVERRMLYVGLGYTSLFTYLVQELSYSEAEAALRIKGMRFINRLPDAKEKMEQGALALSVAASVEGFLIQEKIVDKQVACELLEICLGKSTREVKKILDGRKQQVAVEFLIKLHGVAAEKFSRLKQMMPELTNHEIVTALIEAKLTQVKWKINERASDNKYEVVDKVTGEIKSISIATRRALLLRACGQCEHIDSKTQKRCIARTQLQVEHCYPQAWGGGHDIGNLMILCRAHNLARATKAFGVSKVAGARGLDRQGHESKMKV